MSFWIPITFCWYRTDIFIVSIESKVEKEVAQVAIIVEQNMRFGLILGRLALLKKKLGP